MKLLHSYCALRILTAGWWVSGVATVDWEGAMHHPPEPDFDVTVVVRVCDDEERIGHVLKRMAAHLRSLQLHFEILVADEGSGDNTLAVATLLRPTVRE